MALIPEILTADEFAALLLVGCTPSATASLAELGARLIALGYMADFAGKLRLTTQSRQRIAAGPARTEAA